MAKKPRAPREIEVALPETPLTFPAPLPMSRVVGHSRALGVLDDALKSERIHHCWIFHGPKGVGKFTAALAFAALLLDPTTQQTFGGAFEADPQSQVQAMLAAGSHPDLQIIVKELAAYSADPIIRRSKQTTIPVDVLREFLLAPASLAPSVRNASRSGKVFIIDEAEMLAGAGQNALLKVLEEPPARVTLILVTESEDKLLPTIRSRSQRLYFSPLTQPEMHEWLKGAKLELSSEQEKWLLEFSGGAPGILLAAHTHHLHEWWKRIGPMIASAEKGQYSVELGNAMYDLADKWAKAWVEEHEGASKVAANQTAQDWMLRLVGTYIQRRLREAARQPEPGPKCKPYLTMLDRLRDAEAELGANVNGQFVMEKLSAELSAAAVGE
ncbi:MAG: AAA family ATPase [Planctomycetes bacterium]|nr:AAA family ATPase [Planctomycetota bacterium]